MSKENTEKEEFVRGRHPVKEALQSDREINKVFVQEHISGRAIDEIVGMARAKKLVVSFVPNQNLIP